MLGRVGPALAVEDLRLRHELAVGLPADDDDLVAHDRGAGCGALVVERGQLLPGALTQRVDAVRLTGRQLVAGHEAADHDGFALVRHGREVMQRQRQAGSRRPAVGARVVDLGRRARRPAGDAAEDPELPVDGRRSRILAPEGQVGDGLPVEVRGELGGGDHRWLRRALVIAAAGQQHRRDGGEHDRADHPERQQDARRAPSSRRAGLRRLTARPEGGPPGGGAAGSDGAAAACGCGACRGAARAGGAAGSCRRRRRRPASARQRRSHARRGRRRRGAWLGARRGAISGALLAHGRAQAAASSEARP